MKKQIKIEIRNRRTGKVLFEYSSDDNTIAKTVKKAVENRADLSGADLRDADLRWAKLSGADLRGAVSNFTKTNRERLTFSVYTSNPYTTHIHTYTYTYTYIPHTRNVEIV